MCLTSVIVDFSYPDVGIRGIRGQVSVSGMGENPSRLPRDSRVVCPELGDSGNTLGRIDDQSNCVSGGPVELPELALPMTVPLS